MNAQPYQPDPRPLPGPLDSLHGNLVGFYPPGVNGGPGHPLCIAAAIIAWGYDPLDRPVDLPLLARVRFQSICFLRRMDPNDPDLDAAQLRVNTLNAMLTAARTPAQQTPVRGA
jgi:hypothetical protein